MDENPPSNVIPLSRAGRKRRERAEQRPEPPQHPKQESALQGHLAAGGYYEPPRALEAAINQALDKALDLQELSERERKPVLFAISRDEGAAGLVIATGDPDLGGLLLNLLKSAMVHLGQSRVWPPQPGLEEELAEAIRRRRQQPEPPDVS
ncbi:MAG: hypothetical protein AB1758_10100 [Candidatus Eremiobacterota bacterium]